MSSEPRELILNPLTGRYIRKGGSHYRRLVAQGTIAGDPVIVPPSEQKPPEPMQVQNDRGVVTDLVRLAEENKDALRGLNRAEIDDLLSKALYERLIMKPQSAKAKASSGRLGDASSRPVGRPRGITARPVAITRTVAAPMTKAMQTKKALLDAKAYASDSDEDDDEEAGSESISSADIETSTAQESSDEEEEEEASKRPSRAPARRVR